MDGNKNVCATGLLAVREIKSGHLIAGLNVDNNQPFCHTIIHVSDSNLTGSDGGIADATVDMP